MYINVIHTLVITNNVVSGVNKGGGVRGSKPSPKIFGWIVMQQSNNLYVCIE